MERVGIIGALHEEVKQYIDALEGMQTQTIGTTTFYTGNLFDKPTVIVIGGVGKVNASVCAELLISVFKAKYLLFTGVAGALEPNLKIEDIVIGEEYIQHDVDAQGLGFAAGEIPYMDKTIFQGSLKLLLNAEESAKTLQMKAYKGRILSGDQFINDTEKQQALHKLFKGACVDMESAAVAHVCYLSNTPYLGLRCISDNADHQAHINFEAFTKVASKKLSKLVLAIIEQETLVSTSAEQLEAVKKSVRTIPDWPKKGIQFRDITTLLNDPTMFSKVIDFLCERCNGREVEAIAGIEARGFIIGAAIAKQLGKPFIMIRKKGKLPGEVITQTYDLEYGTDTIEISKDIVTSGQHIVLVDDLLATGGTALAAATLLEKVGGKVDSCLFVIDLPALGGKTLLEKKGYDTYTLIDFEGE